MPLAIPPELKKITPYVRRAEELDKDTSSPESRLLAYYCRQYAVHIGIPLAGTSPGAKTCLGHLLENLEAEKPAMDNFTREEAAFLCRKFAHKVFDRADEEDRLGLASKDTAKTFFAASTFLKILDQFTSEDDQSEERLEDKRRIIHAKWKCTDILKAMNEMRTPVPSGYGEEGADMGIEGNGEEFKEEKVDEKKRDAPMAETVQEDDEDYAVPEVYKPPPITIISPPTEDDNEDETVEVQEGFNEEGTEIELGPPPAYPGADLGLTSPELEKPKVSFELPSAVPPPKKVGGLFGFGKKKSGPVTKAQIKDAVELTRFALAALEDRDADLAAERLQQALVALGR